MLLIWEKLVFKYKYGSTFRKMKNTPFLMISSLILLGFLFIVEFLVNFKI
ncbi:hypothetical protein IT568_01520 [bacterium]|nr:hypothetical protein [bacterium]